MREPARLAGLALLRLRPHVDWAPAVTTIDDVLKPPRPLAHSRDFAGVAEGDLFAPADVICR
ncbi:hypothetical protein [Sinosporangium siamense]|uniref:hypothetical protein n=1 Tax=Sinosporangium siamense TaxID=1367973 RepID=UPI00195191B5|nr:hypothetical protein [Sinosporangium siamense]